MRVLTFGELLLRLTAPGYTRLFQKDNLDASFCGGEANVAVSLAQFGISTGFLTKLPDNAVGIAAARSLQYFGVDVSKILYGTGRMGLYYLEKGASQRPSKVIYDREYSSISLARRDAFDWSTLLQGVDWVHWTGINPALSDSVAQICMDMCHAAKERNITVSCDLNYRASLWSSEDAQRVMTQLMPYVDVCIANEEDAEKVLGIKASGTSVEEAKLSHQGYHKVAKKLCEIYGCNYAAITLRESYSASTNGWSATLYDAKLGKAYDSAKYDIQIVDRVGGGDSFAAGLIYGLVTGKRPQEVVDFAVASSCLKHTMEGDYNRTTVAEVENLLHSGGCGRVQR